LKQFFLITWLFFLFLAAFSQNDFEKHIVKNKETLYSISKDYGVTVIDLMRANPGLDVRIHEGQVILIPKIVNESEYVIFYVTSKTNMRKVAGLYNVSVSTLKEENPDLDYRLYPGQNVKIPVGNKTFSEDEISEITPEPIPEPEKLDENILIKSFCNPEYPNMFKTFKVALMIPLYLHLTDSLDKEQFLKTENEDFLPFRFISFYEGALIAADSLKKQGMNIKLYVYDVDNDAAKTYSLLQNPDLEDVDLIIGPFFNKSFEQVARFAGRNGIPIVNPLSFREEIITNYSSVIKVKPGNSSQYQLIADLIKEDFSDSRVFLIKQSEYQDAEEVSTLQQLLENTIPRIQKIPNSEIYNWAKVIAKEQEINFLTTVTIEGTPINPESLENKLSDSTVFVNKLMTINYSKDSLNTFIKSASQIRNSLVIIYSDNKPFIMDAMNRLNELRDTFNIQIIGLPNWERIDNLDNNQCNDMNLVYLTSTFTDYNLPKIERFNYYFRQKYYTEPGEYAFSGFDVTYFFLYTLFHFDKHFSACLDSFKMNLFQSSYQFKRVDNSDNFENTYWNILEYNKFSLKKLPDPSISN